jgi:hypothetical protein
MAERSIASLAVLGGFVRQLSALLTGPPACAICGRGRASTGWLLDPSGRINGRCLGCLGDAPRPMQAQQPSRPQPPP